MRKNFNKIILLIFMSLFMIKNVSALQVYSSNYNTYYQRSQHTYAWHDLQDTHWTNFAPAIYILYNNYEDASREEEWNFDEKYTRPWTIDNKDYYLTLCADLIYDFWPVKTYNVVSLSDSTYLNAEIKGHINAIVKHSYPFISEEEMVKELVTNGILVESTNTEGEKIYTAKKNIEEEQEVEYTINKDELLSAIQLALYYYTDNDKVDEVYYNTAILSTNFSVLDRSANYEVSGYYNTVNNNIEAVYNYLISLEDNNYYEPVKIEKIVANENNELIISLSNESNINNLKLKVKENNELIADVNVKDLIKDNFHNYILPLKNVNNINNVEVTLAGSVYKESEVLVFEALDGKENSQTLVGLASTDIPIQEKIVTPSNYVKLDDLNIKKTVDKEVVGPNENLTYEITIKNESDNLLENIQLVDEISEYFEIISTDGTINYNAIIWEFSLLPHEEKKVSAVLKLKDNIKDKSITNTVTGTMYNMKKSTNVNVDVIKNPKTGNFLNINLIFGISIIGLLGFLLKNNVKRKLFKI